MRVAPASALDAPYDAAMTDQPRPQPEFEDHDGQTVRLPDSAQEQQGYQSYPPAAAASESLQPAYALPATGPLGKVRSTGVCILLFLVTLGIYGLYWYYAVHRDMKEHTGRGIGGVIALIIAFFVGIVMPFITSSEVGELYRARGQEAPVTGATGLWYFPGMLILVGPIIWFVKTNGRLNDYWSSLGAQ